MLRDAVLSDDGQFRYRLDRIWDARLPKVGWIMLNPSTADGLVDDATIRKCIGFSSAWGFGSMSVGNVFAFRARDPRHLQEHGWLFGPMNEHYIMQIARECDFVVCGWGVNVRKYPMANAIEWKMRQLLLGHDTRALKILAGNIPGHPLMLAYRTKLIKYVP